MQKQKMPMMRSLTKRVMRPATVVVVAMAIGETESIMIESDVIMMISTRIFMRREEEMNGASVAIIPERGGASVIAGTVMKGPAVTVIEFAT